MYDTIYEFLFFLYERDRPRYNEACLPQCLIQFQFPIEVRPTATKTDRSIQQRVCLSA
jgi:hypothetical protein